MHTTVVPRFVRRLGKIASITLVVLLSIGSLPESALAVSSWSPTLLVNTESFQTIDAGDGTTSIDLRFGSTTYTLKLLTNGKFQFSKSLSVLGGLSGSYLTIDSQANISGALTVKSTIRTNSDLTINGDADANDATLTFGNTSGNQTIKFLNTSQKFQFSRGLSVVGIISGSQLAVDGSATISGALLVKTGIASKGYLSGSTLSGFGLGSCNANNQKLVYNNVTNKFECTTDLTGGGSSNTGALQVKFDERYVNQSGDTMTGILRINKQGSSYTGALLNVVGGMSGYFLRTSGSADIHGALSASGAFRTDSNITINDDADTNDATLTFGNSTGNQTLKFLNTSQKFQFSRGLSVVGIISGSQLAVDGAATISGALLVKSSIKTKGNLSGSTLTVDGNVTLHGVTYNAPTSQGSANTVLKNDGAGNLTWSSTIANGSGGILSYHPEYPNAIYFSSGSTYIGQMTMSGGTTDLENSYAWTTSRGTLQDYWVSVRVRLPDNFSSWDPTQPVTFRFKTGVAGGQNNHLTLRIRDTAGAPFLLTGGLVGTSFTTARVQPKDTAAFTSGTWTPKGYFTVYVKMAATNAANAAAYASYLNFNYETTTP